MHSLSVMHVRLLHGLLLSGIATAALALASCDRVPVTAACTTRPCPTGLAIELVGDLPENYLIRIPEYSVWIECTPITPCDPPVLVPGITPSSVFLQVDGRGFEIDREFVPEYDVTFPNGLECGECRLGTITVPVD